ncbi:hypothetical protein C0075_21735 [Rhizobium sp. KAs_5_22]|nr:hypothetical protein C0075_21735 [Rhizobium sp. KAs_5_22]
MEMLLLARLISADCRSRQGGGENRVPQFLIRMGELGGISLAAPWLGRRAKGRKSAQGAAELPRFLR